MNILYLDLDTLRPDHLGCYGYHRNTSPNIDRLAEDGVRFENFYTSDAPCLPSRSALMTGMFGIHSGVVNHAGRNADFRAEKEGRAIRNRMSNHTMPEFLKKNLSFYPVYIGGFAERHSSFDFYAGFREIYDTGKLGNESAEEVTPAVLDWIERNGARQDNWYLHVNYWDAHGPYRVPDSFGNPFADDPIPEWITAQEIERQKRDCVGPSCIRDICLYDHPGYPRWLNRIDHLDDAHRVFDGYDCGIKYIDSHIGMILDKLQEKGMLDQTIIIISADHGENFGELGVWAEHATADFATCRIPLIVRWPGLRQGHVNRGLHYNIDLLPTLAELFAAAPCPSWDGESFAAAIRDGDTGGRGELILSQCAHGCQRSVRWGDWLYIRTYHDYYHQYPPEMLYHLVDDPHEQRNLAAERPDLCGEAARLYLNWHDRMMATQPDGYFHDPLWEVMLRGGPHYARNFRKKYYNLLQSTGRADLAERMKSSHPEEFSSGE
jgi:arylsulfatase A-like enzyme